MSVKSLGIGPLFGIGVVSVLCVTAACSGDAFSSRASSLDHGGSGGTNAVDPPPQAGSANNTPKGGTGNVVESEGGAPQEVLPTAGGMHTGGTDGGVASAGSGGNVVAPPEPGAGGDTSVTEPPIDPTPTPILEDWSKPLGKATSWYTAFGDPKVDTDKHQLVLSYDDVAERTQPYAGSYYAESDVTIAGKTVFTPYPYCFEVLLPSLRRDAAGDVELGATQYAGTWHDSGWGDASGSVIAGTTKLHVAFYMQTTAKKFAVKVSDGDKVYRSAWVTDFHWAKTNLGIMRYVGENNSSVYAGSDAIYVDQVSGWQGLDDAAVAAAFAN